MAKKRRLKENGALSGTAGPHPGGKPLSPLKGTRAGASQRSGYASIVGKAPDCRPGDRATAASFLKKIELAIDQGGWKPGERTRLYRLRDKWKARAEGKDPRFNVAGTRAGRLDKSIEDAIEGAVKRRQKEKTETSRTRDRRRRSFDWSAYEDLDAPFGFAKGGIDVEELEGNLGDDETGEAHRPRKRGEREFIVPGQDANGHSHRVQCRVMPAHYRALSIIYTSKKFPFRTLGDIVRWCIDRGIRELGTIAKTSEIESVLAQVDVIREILAEESHQQEFLATFDQMARTVSQHTAADAVGEARRVVALIRNQIGKMPEGYWRTRYLDELTRRFGHLLDSTVNAGVALIPPARHGGG